MNQCFGLKVHKDDNVATLFTEAAKGDLVVIADKEGNQWELSAKGIIPYGHKIALLEISSGAEILKYGECIGAATFNILCGEHVHIHNMDSLRGRGDLAAENKKEVRHAV